MSVGRMMTFRTHEEYDRYPAQRSTQLKEIVSTHGPRGYYDKYICPVPKIEVMADNWGHIQPKVGTLQMGTLLHEWVLQGIKKWFECSHKRGSKAWLDALDEHEGLLAVSKLQAAQLKAWRDSLLRNPIVRDAVEGGSFKEQAFEFEHHSGERGKARVDLFNIEDLSIWDLKSTRHDTHEGFLRQCQDLRYDFSAAFYEHARNSVPELKEGRRAPFKHIALCKTYPYPTYVWEFSREHIHEGKIDIDPAFACLQECRKHQQELEEIGGDPREAWPDKQAADADGKAPTWRWLAGRGWSEDSYDPYAAHR